MKLGPEGLTPRYLKKQHMSYDTVIGLVPDHVGPVL